MTRYRRLGRIRKRYHRQLRIRFEPQLREQRATFRDARRHKRTGQRSSS